LARTETLTALLPFVHRLPTLYGRPVRAWSLYVATGGTTYVGHDGYEDVVATHYAYDSSVPNHTQVNEGDLLILRDGHGSLGVARAETLKSRAGTKRRRRCPTCGTSQVELRKSLAPQYRCTNGHTFENPVAANEPTTLYRLEYGRSFRPFDRLTATQMERLCVAAAKQNAIRELNVDRTLASLRAHGMEAVPE